MEIFGAHKQAAQSLLADSFPTARALEPEQPEQCQLSVLVPSYGEGPVDVIKQLTWLLRQDTDLSNIEVIYAVNNSPPQESSAWQAAYDRNQAVLNLPIFQNNRDKTNVPAGYESECQDIRQALAVVALDLSSPGSWLEGCNVGLVRQRLLGEAAFRFASKDQNGLLFFTDVDAYLEEPGTIQRTLDVFDAQRRLLAVPGAITQEADPSHPESRAIAANFERVKLASVWSTLLKVWERGYVRLDPLRFYGPCMIMRAYEAADTGGFSLADRVATDVSFGERLVEYAHNNAYHVTHGRELGVGVINALRWSGRTRNNSLHEGFRIATTPGPMMVESPFDPGAGPQELTPDLLQQLVEAVQGIEDGPAYTDHMLHRSFIVNARIAANEAMVPEEDLAAS